MKIMKIIKIMMTKFKTFINFNLIFFCLLILTWFFWTKFIKKRLPSDIPFILTEYRFFALLFLCFSYIFIIYIILKKKNNTNNKSFIKKLSEFFFLPFEKTDRFIKNKINTKYINFFLKINKEKKNDDNLNVLDYLIPAPVRNIYEKKKYPKAKYFYIIFNIIPRIILVSILIVDIFIFQRVEYFYTFVLLSLFPLCHRYMKYSLQNIEKDIIYYLQLRFEKVELEDQAININFSRYLLFAKDNPDKYPGNKYHEKMCTVEEYFAILKEVEEYNYMVYKTCIDDDKEYVIDDDDNDNDNDNNNILDKQKFIDLDTFLFFNNDFFYKDLKDKLKIEKKEEYTEIEKKKINEFNKKYYDSFEKVVIINNDIKNFINIYSNIEEHFSIKITRVIIYTFYFICWAFILYKSVHTVNDWLYTKIFIKLLQKIKIPDDIF